VDVLVAQVACASAVLAPTPRQTTTLTTSIKMRFQKTFFGWYGFDKNFFIAIVHIPPVSTCAALFMHVLSVKINCGSLALSWLAMIR
jgi:hypothetical protein